jgi:hypothetical protein
LNQYRTQPPWDFLLTASRNSLQSYELSRLSHAANLRKEIFQLLESWIDENSAALLARWLMEHRQRPAAAVTEESDVLPDVSAENGHTGETASHNVFADSAAARHVHRARH